MADPTPTPEPVPITHKDKLLAVRCELCGHRNTVAAPEVEEMLGHYRDTIEQLAAANARMERTITAMEGAQRKVDHITFK